MLYLLYAAQFSYEITVALYAVRAKYQNKYIESSISTKIVVTAGSSEVLHFYIFGEKLLK